MMNDAEREAMAKINVAGAAVLLIDGDRLASNREEVYAAIHVLQGFVIQHMLQRLEPETFGTWYDDRDG